MPTADDTLALVARANAAQEAGRLDEAEALCRMALSGRPESAEACFVFGGSILMDLTPYERTTGEFPEDTDGKITGFQ